MLRHMNMHSLADNIENAILGVIAEGKVRQSYEWLIYACTDSDVGFSVQHTTGDLGGKATNTAFTQAVCERLV